MFVSQKDPVDCVVAVLQERGMPSFFLNPGH